MPNPPRPIEAKRRRGTLRADRTPNLASLAVVPPIDLEGWALSPRQALERVLEAGVGWLAATDHPKVAMLLEALELHERAKEVGSIRDQLLAMKEVRACMSELGFDPTARSSLGLAEVKTLSTLEALRAETAVGNGGGGRRSPKG